MSQNNILKSCKDDATSPYDWEQLQLGLLSLNPQYKVLSACLPKEPALGCFGSSTAMYPTRDTNIFKKD